jgi:hypothetical protein
MHRSWKRAVGEKKAIMTTQAHQKKAIIDLITGDAKMRSKRETKT